MMSTAKAQPRSPTIINAACKKLVLETGKGAKILSTDSEPLKYPKSLDIHVGFNDQSWRSSLVAILRQRAMKNYRTRAQLLT